MIPSKYPYNLLLVAYDRRTVLEAVAHPYAHCLTCLCS